MNEGNKKKKLKKDDTITLVVYIVYRYKIDVVNIREHHLILIN